MHPYLEPVDNQTPEFPDYYDELPLWSAPFARLLLQKIPLRRGINILDLGCGTGFLTLELAQRCGPDSVVHAVDPWQSAMDRLARKALFLNLENVRLHPVDAARMDLPDNSIGLIVSNLGVNNFDNRQAVLAECHRVMKTGGDLFLSTNLVGHMAEFYKVFEKTLRELRLTDQIGALETHIAHRATPGSVHQLLEKASLKVVDTTLDTFQERYADGSSLLRHYFIRLGFLPAWIALIPESSRDDFFTALEANLNAAVRTDGISLTIPMACIHAKKSG